MISYTGNPIKILKGQNREIPSFISRVQGENIDWVTVESFGDEWEKFAQFTEEEIKKCGEDYFDIIPEELLKGNTSVLDIGCGTGRWTSYIQDKVGHVDAIDPSKAVLVADKLLGDNKKVRIAQASVDSIPFPDNSYDLVFSLGVLHHIPDTFDAMRKAVSKVKPGGYFLVYLYYNLDNRGFIFKTLFHFSNLLRFFVSALPQKPKSIATDILAVTLYMPFVLVSRVATKVPYFKNHVSKIPLSYYRDKTFNIIRNDSLDRFGTPLEHRFSKTRIKEMMLECGLGNIVFSSKEPYWHAIGRKK